MTVLRLRREHLPPVFRCEPSIDRGIFTIALDPREAEFVLERGWVTLDGIRYRVNLYGLDGQVEGDGRVVVRCALDEPGCISHREAVMLRLAA
jgi:hypothetical protein